MRTLLRTLTALLIVALPRASWAQGHVVPVEPELPPPPDETPPPGPAVPPGALPPGTRPVKTSDYPSKVRGHKPSPEWTQDRNFSTTRFWLLDPGSYGLETWWWTRIYNAPSGGGAKDPESIRFFQEVTIGVAPHLQLDLYGEFRLDAQDDVGDPSKQSRYFSYKGYRAEMRVAIPNYYGQIPLNPVIYLEYMNFIDDPQRVEVRLLLGGAPTRWLFLAANPYFEINVTPSNKDFTDAMNVTTTRAVYLGDAEAGTTLAAGFRITDWLNLSLQAKIGGDMLGDENNKFHFVFWLGPGLIIKPLPKPHQQMLKIIATALFLMPGSDTNGGPGKGYDVPQSYEPTLIIGSEF